MRGAGFYKRVKGRVRRHTVRGQLDQISARTKKYEQSAKRTAKEAEFHVREVNRISPQLAALETKVEDLRQQLEAVPVAADGQEVAESRRLVEAIQREHQQIRVRLSAVTTYEERLRRIEEKLGLPHD